MGKHKRKSPPAWIDRRQLVTGAVVGVFTVVLGKSVDFILSVAPRGGDAAPPTPTRSYRIDAEGGRLTIGGHPVKPLGPDIATATMTNAATATGTNAAGFSCSTVQPCR